MKLVQLFEQVSLFEAAKDRYMQPFTGLLSIAEQLGLDNLSEGIDNAISWAMRTLKKEDKIVWFLRWMKLEALRILKLNTEGEVRERVHKAWDKAATKISKNSGISKEQIESYANQFVSGGFRTQMNHYMSLGLPAIDDYVFTWQTPEQIFRDFQVIEQEWQKKLQELVPIERDEVETVIKFPDGSEWINLNKPACDVEAKAMGHCGNADTYHPDDTVLSYRTIEKNNKGEEMWKPRLTFILDTKNGMLGEMKGRANQKPDAKYHGVIIDLLKHPLIKGIKGGGYKPENNFSIDDLPKEVVEKLIDMKPGLADIRYDYNKRGITRELLTRMNQKFDDETDGALELPEYDNKRKVFLGETMEGSVDDFVKEYGGDTANWVVNILSGEEHLDIYHTANDPEDLWNILPDKITTRVGHWLLKNYSDAVEEWKEENDENFDPSDANAAWHIIEEHSIDEVKTALNSAMLDAEYIGTEAEMLNSLKDWLKKLPNRDGFDISLYPGHTKWDAKQYVVISEKSMIDIVTDMMDQVAWHGSLISFFEIEDLESPYHGWHGFDEQVAIEQAEERLSVEGIL